MKSHLYRSLCESDGEQKVSVCVCDMKIGVWGWVVHMHVMKGTGLCVYDI